MRDKLNWDTLGITTSLACAVHCAVLPLLLTSLPVFGIDIIDNVSFEYCMIFLAFIVGCFALYHGYKKHHHNWLPIVTFSIGILLLLAKQAWHIWQLWLLVPAVVLIIVSHYLNYRLCKKANHCHTSDCNH